MMKVFPPPLLLLLGAVIVLHSKTAFAQPTCVINLPDGSSATFSRGESFGILIVDESCTSEASSDEQFPCFCAPDSGNNGVECPYCRYERADGTTACSADSALAILADANGVSQECTCDYIGGASSSIFRDCSPVENIAPVGFPSPVAPPPVVAVPEPQCTLQISASLEKCDELLEEITEDCDCYDFCGKDLVGCKRFGVSSSVVDPCGGQFDKAVFGCSRPITEAPITEAPITEAPITEAPITEAPITEAPITSAPITSAPITSAPITSAPITSAPVTAAPITQAPVTGAPVTEAPVTVAPITGAPVTVAPISQAPFTSAPATNSSDVPFTVAPFTIAPIGASLAPVTLAPGTVAPGTVAPGTVAPATTAPGTVAPATTAPITASPVTMAPITIAPITMAPVTEAPVTEAPVTEAPVTEAPVTEAPITPRPTINTATRPPFDGVARCRVKIRATSKNCEPRLANITADQETCDCYNFCGNEMVGCQDFSETVGGGIQEPCSEDQGGFNAAVFGCSNNEATNTPTPTPSGAMSTCNVIVAGLATLLPSFLMILDF